MAKIKKELQNSLVYSKIITNKNTSLMKVKSTPTIK